MTAAHFNCDNINSKKPAGISQLQSCDTSADTDSGQLKQQHQQMDGKTACVKHCLQPGLHSSSRGSLPTFASLQCYGPRCAIHRTVKLQAARAEAKELIFDNESRKRMQNGINKLADAVGVSPAVCWR